MWTVWTLIQIKWQIAWQENKSLLFDNFMPECHIFQAQQRRSVGVNSQLTSRGLSCHNVFMLYKKQIPWDVTRLLHQQTVQDWAESISCEVPQARKRSQDFLIEKKGMNKDWIVFFFVFFLLFKKRRSLWHYFLLCVSAAEWPWGFAGNQLFIFSQLMTPEWTGTEACRWNGLVERSFSGRTAVQNGWVDISFSGSLPLTTADWDLSGIKLDWRSDISILAEMPAERVDRNLSFKNVKSHLGRLAYDVW